MTVVARFMGGGPWDGRTMALSDSDEGEISVYMHPSFDLDVNGDDDVIEPRTCLYRQDGYTDDGLARYELVREELA